MMPKTIRAKISLLTGGLSLAILFGFSVFLYSSLRIQLYQSVDNDLRVHAERLISSIENENGQLRFNREDRLTSNLGVEDIVRIVSTSGTVLDSLGDEFVPLTSFPEKDENRFVTLRFIEEVLEEKETVIFRLLSTPITMEGNPGAYLQVGRDLEPVQEALARLLGLLLLAGPVLVGVASLGGYWLTGQALAPIEKIRQRAASIHARDLSQRLDLKTTEDEVGRLARTFNEMLDRLEASFQRQRRFASDASHELRTPLAVIRGEIDVALERPRDRTDYVETLQSVDEEAQRMSRLVNDLLQLARADANELRLEFEQFDLADLLRLLVEKMQRQAQEAQVDLKTDLPASLPITGDRDRILELFVNLLENAIVHAPGSRVEVRAQTAGENIVVTITDTGPGIPEEHLPHLFERFYRVDQSRDRSRDGSGLGLALAQEIAHAHQGHISVQSQLEKGTTLIVQL
jgi:heavy metal sensor kinase